MQEQKELIALEAVLFESLKLWCHCRRAKGCQAKKQRDHAGMFARALLEYRDALGDEKMAILFPNVSSVLRDVMLL